MEGGLEPPAAWPQFVPVTHHADLTNGEAQEDADGEERNERVRAAAGEQQQSAGDSGQPHHTVPVYLPVAL